MSCFKRNIEKPALLHVLLWVQLVAKTLLIDCRPSVPMGGTIHACNTSHAMRHNDSFIDPRPLRCSLAHVTNPSMRLGHAASKLWLSKVKSPPGATSRVKSRKRLQVSFDTALLFVVLVRYCFQRSNCSCVKDPPFVLKVGECGMMRSQKASAVSRATISE